MVMKITIHTITCKKRCYPWDKGGSDDQDGQKYDKTSNMMNEVMNQQEGDPRH